jgi:hypothetical protein
VQSPLYFSVQALLSSDTTREVAIPDGDRVVAVLDAVLSTSEKQVRGLLVLFRFWALVSN